MKNLTLIFLSSFPILFFSLTIAAQDDETRQASGLPIKVGENVANPNKVNLSGKITILGFSNSKPKPIIFVLVYLGGALIDKRQTNDSGVYFVPNIPREGVVMSVEADGVEVNRFQLPPTFTGSLRQDLSINLGESSNEKNKPSVLDANFFYKRTDENEKLFIQAAKLSKENKSVEAVTVYKKILTADPKDFVSWTELGTLYFRNEKFSDAEECYNKALELNPDFTLASLNLGKLFLAQKQPEKAIDILSKAVVKNPSSPDINQYLGEAYLQVKKGSKAVVYLNEAIRLAPVEKAEIHLRLATLYDAAGLKNKAAEEYTKFLEKVPNYKDKDKLKKYIAEHSEKQKNGLK